MLMDFIAISENFYSFGPRSWFSMIKKEQWDNSLIDETVVLVRLEKKCLAHFFELNLGTEDLRAIWSGNINLLKFDSIFDPIVFKL